MNKPHPPPCSPHTVRVFQGGLGTSLVYKGHIYYPASISSSNSSPSSSHPCSVPFASICGQQGSSPCPIQLSSCAWLGWFWSGIWSLLKLSCRRISCPIVSPPSLGQKPWLPLLLPGMVRWKDTCLGGGEEQELNQPVSPCPCNPLAVIFPLFKFDLWNL